MNQQPFYDPKKTYQENYEKGPFGLFSNPPKYPEKKSPQFSFLGYPVNLLFGIPAGPLVNGKFVKAALDMGFDLPIYKTVRTRQYPCHEWPNVLGVNIQGDLTSEKAATGLVVKDNYDAPLSITNSFGVPSYNPDIWQKDLAETVEYAKEGQLVIGGFQGTRKKGESKKELVADFALGAKLMKETGVKVLEINFSCPNEKTCDLICFDPELVFEIIGAVKCEIGSTKLIIKLAYFRDELILGKLIEKVGNIVDGISAINTFPAVVRDKLGRQALPGEGRLVSGICGESIKWAGLEMVGKLKKLREDLGLAYSIIGVGGVKGFQDYDDYVKAGADAVMSATGAMWNPLLAQEIREGKK